jgi:hypothetical protein
VIDVGELTVNELALVVPNLTDDAAVKPVPVMVTLVPPAVGPELGLTAVTVGAPRYEKWSAADVAEIPPGVVTVTSTVPAGSAGEVAVIDVAELTVNEVALVAPNVTADAAVKPVPEMVTLVAPPVGPALGLTAVTVGAPWYEKWSAADFAEVPVGVVTVTSTVPADPAGEVAVIDVSELTVNEPALVAPNVTADAAVSPEPVMVTVVPPAVGPALGLTAVTVPAAGTVSDSVWLAAVEPVRPEAVRVNT